MNVVTALLLTSCLDDVRGLRDERWVKRKEGKTEIGHLFGDCEHGRQWCHREGERDDARIYYT
jgi:hypothetical protein